jgi:hypothetical protein
MKDSQINIVSLKGNWFVYLSLRLDPRISLYSFNVKLFAAQLKINCTSLQIVHLVLEGGISLAKSRALILSEW